MVLLFSPSLLFFFKEEGVSQKHAIHHETAHVECVIYWPTLHDSNVTTGNYTHKSQDSSALRGQRSDYCVSELTQAQGISLTAHKSFTLLKPSIVQSQLQGLALGHISLVVNF